MDKILSLIGKTVEVSDSFLPPFRKVKLVEYKKEQPSFLVEDNGEQKWVERIFVS